MITTIFDHRSGLSVVPEYLVEGVKTVLSNINPTIKKNTVSDIRDCIISGIELQGWSGEYRLDATSKITISSYMEEIGLCIQTGNVGRIYADLIKLQSLYLKGNIKAGIIILPQKALASALASNMASYERLIGELPIFKQVISMPLVIIGFRSEETL